MNNLLNEGKKSYSLFNKPYCSFKHMTEKSGKHTKG